MEIELDEIDKKILDNLSEDARKVTAPEIAKETNVSPSTIRNRISRLERKGVIKGYDLDLDYEKLNMKFVELFMCSSPNISSRDVVSKKALEIDRVVNVRKLNSGDIDVHVKAVARDVGKLDLIGRKLEEIGLDIIDECLLNEESSSKLEFMDKEEDNSLINFKKLESGASILDLSVTEGSEICGHTLEEAKEQGILSKDTLVISIERDGNRFTPQGDTLVRESDIVSVFSTTSVKEEIKKIF